MRQYCTRANTWLKNPQNVSHDAAASPYLPREASSPREVCLSSQGMCLQVAKGRVCKGRESTVCFNRQLLGIAEEFPALIGGHRSFQSMMQQTKGRWACQREKKNRSARESLCWCLCQKHVHWLGSLLPDTLRKVVLVTLTKHLGTGPLYKQGRCRVPMTAT